VVSDETPPVVVAVVASGAELLDPVAPPAEDFDPEPPHAAPTPATRTIATTSLRAPNRADTGRVLMAAEYADSARSVRTTPRRRRLVGATM
jgi:hypothetical protein